MIFYITETKTQPFYAEKHKIPICGDNDKKSVIIFAENVCIFKKDLYLCTAFERKRFPIGKPWRGGRVVDCGGLENRCTARYPGFESLSLRR